MPRQGDEFSVQIEVIETSATAASDVDFDCVVQTKNNEDSDNSPTVLGSTLSPTVTAGTVSNDQYSGALELVRYKYTLTGTSSQQWVHFRANAPIWFPN
tara:strand:+ start:1775 stop:2071 length:297 start_codon:yes stop_codon:yes gene_type:complete